MSARSERARAAARDGTLGLAQVEIDGELADVIVNEAESPLGWLARRKDRAGRPLIAHHQLVAGERLRLDFTRAGMTPRLTADWQAPVAAGGRGTGRGDPAAFSDVVLAAKRRLAQALEAVGPEFTGVLLDVCCFLKGLELVERERGWPSRAGKIVLCLGLDRLARHYGLSGEARGPAASRGVRAWSAPREGDAR